MQLDNNLDLRRSHGFKDENIAERMHIVIRRHESPRWFSYWVARFDAMWQTAKPPEPAALPAGSAEQGRSS